jgi:hypothetical protein
MKNDIWPPEPPCCGSPVAHPVKVNIPAATNNVHCITLRIENSFQVGQKREKARSNHAAWQGTAASPLLFL